MKKIIVFTALLALTACKSNKAEAVVEDENTTEYSNASDQLEKNFSINGTIKNAINQPITLEVTSDKGVIQLARSVVKSDGTFSLSGNIRGMGLYQLKVGNENKIIPLTMEPKDNIQVNADYATFDRLPSISGAEWAKVVTTYMQKFNDFAGEQDQLMKQQSLTQEQQIKEFMRIRKPLDDYAREQILKDPSNPGNIILITSMTPAMGFENWNPENLTAIKAMATGFEAKYKDNAIANSMKTQYQQIEQAYQEFAQFSKDGGKSGMSNSNETIAEIALKSPEGKIIKLSSLRGKVVLVDFWASWCGPCRKENPTVVAAYNKFKDKGFTVYSVSLDKDAEAWKRAIKADELVWGNHVSDLKMWDSEVIKTFGIQGIPYTLLIDKKGKIIASNLRGPALEQKLLEVLK